MHNKRELLKRNVKLQNLHLWVLLYARESINLFAQIFQVGPDDFIIGVKRNRLFKIGVALVASGGIMLKTVMDNILSQRIPLPPTVDRNSVIGIMCAGFNRAISVSIKAHVEGL
mgnify:CR=1 FL=1